MLEQTRAAVFNMLGEAVEGVRVLDLFSGTGSLGLEAVSRGAVFVEFVERDRVARECLRENIDKLQIGECCKINASPVATIVASIADKFGLVFIDPPYPDVVVEASRTKTMQLIREVYDKALDDGGMLVFHFPTRSLGERDFADFPVHRMREYGRNSVVLISKNNK